MNINPIEHTVSEPYEIKELFTPKDDIANKLIALEKAAQAAEAEVIAVGPENHLRALQANLLKQGYKKAK